MWERLTITMESVGLREDVRMGRGVGDPGGDRGSELKKGGGRQMMGA